MLFQLKDFAPLFGGLDHRPLLLVRSPSVLSLTELTEGDEKAVAQMIWDGPDSRELLLRWLKENDDHPAVIWIADDEFEHYNPGDLGSGSLAAMSFFSSGLNPGNLAASLDIIRRTDPVRELAIEQQFLEWLDHGTRLYFRVPQYSLTATLEYTECDHWFSLHGPLGPGHQTVLPTGELSVLADASGEFSATTGLPLNGSLLLRGEPVTHRGSRRISLEETRAAYQKASALRQAGVRAEVRDGFIVEIRPLDEHRPEGANFLQELFDEHPEYRKVHEIGFGTNANCQPLRGDLFFPDERYPGVHFGIGLGEYLPFHIDMVCPETDVVIELHDGRTVDVYRALGLR